MSQTSDPTPTNPTYQVLFTTQQTISPEPRIHYIDHYFEVPPGASKVGLTLSFFKKELAQIFLSLHDPSGFRGNRMRPGGKGEIVLDCWVSPDCSSEGAIPGDLPPGKWRAQLDIERLGETVDYTLIAYAEFEQVPKSSQLAYPDQLVINPNPGWYKGELHAHSTESDGKFPVATVIQAAQDAGLDFFALTDHFTCSQWWKLAKLAEQTKLALLRSLEITSHQGHANLHGLSQWVDVFVDRPSWSMNQAADDVHAQGGLFCINHPFSADLAWKAYDFDWDKADLMEIYHNLEGANNNLHGGLWDKLLSQGKRIIGVAGTDSHDPFTGTNRINQVNTWIYADELSEKGIIQGLKRGNVFISRGPEIRFTLQNQEGETAEMGQSLSTAGQPVSIQIKAQIDEQCRLFILRDGLLFDSFTLDRKSDWTEVILSDASPPSSGYYRMELHKYFKHPDHPGIHWRDYSTMLAISNPIWVK
jgi:predicted metal-dependent phosphoesterase TrpH